MFVRLTLKGHAAGYYNTNTIMYYGRMEKIDPASPKYQTEVRIMGFSEPFYAEESVKAINLQLKGTRRPTVI